MLEDETGRSPRLQTSAFQNVRCVSDLGTEPLKVVVKNATAWLDGCTSKGVQVTSHSCVVGMNLKHYWHRYNVIHEMYFFKSKTS
jgi:hypothetical protein